jgi:hypothetical protein
MKRTFKAPKKYKINFCPQHPSKKGYLVTIRTALLVLALEQDIQVPDKTNIIAGGLIIIVVLMLFLYHDPNKPKCRTVMCYGTKRNASRDTPLESYGNCTHQRRSICGNLYGVKDFYNF